MGGRRCHIKANTVRFRHVVLLHRPAFPLHTSNALRPRPNFMRARSVGARDNTHEGLRRQGDEGTGGERQPRRVRGEEPRHHERQGSAERAPGAGSGRTGERNVEQDSGALRWQGTKKGASSRRAAGRRGDAAASALLGRRRGGGEERRKATRKVHEGNEPGTELCQQVLVTAKYPGGLVGGEVPRRVRRRGRCRREGQGRHRLAVLLLPPRGKARPANNRKSTEGQVQGHGVLLSHHC
mmetsp:Transcript_8159/g.14794  ORF Transcript_8159/g.14794 Transcript_8159/m.14794 type:complete len:239 (-) Transcript_8159:1165-1881(-)